MVFCTELSRCYGLSLPIWYRRRLFCFVETFRQSRVDTIVRVDVNLVFIGYVVQKFLYVRRRR